MDELATDTAHSEAPAPDHATAASSPAPDRREVITRIVAEHSDDGSSLRDKMIAAGKIKPGQQRQRPQEAPRPSAPQPQATPTGALPLPKWLKKELEGEWGKASPTLQQAFAKYGEDAGRGIDRYRTAAQAHEAMMSELAPYDQMIRAEGGTPQTAVRNLLQVAAQLRNGSPQDKAMLVARTMQQYGVPFEHVAQMFGSQQHSQSADHMADQRAAAAIEAFAQQGRPGFDGLRPQIARLIQGGLVEGSDHKSEMEILDAAYELALRMHPGVQQQMIAAERERAIQEERDKANRVARVSRAAAVQVSGAPGSASLPPVDPKDRRSAIRRAIALHTRG